MLKKSFLLAFLCSAALYAAPDNDVVSRSYVAKYLGRVSEAEWEKRGRHGEIITIYSNGVTVTQSFLEGRLQGRTIRTYPHSDKPAQMKVYDEGCLTKQIDYYPSSLVKQEQLFTNSQTGGRTVTLYREDGTMLSIETLKGGSILEGQYFDQKGKFLSSVSKQKGERSFVDEAGKLTQVDQVSAGHIVGRTTYYPNGSVKARLSFRDNQLDGTAQYFQTSGAPSRLEQWAAGKQNGLTLIFSNGEKVSEVPYVDGKKTGVERRFKNETTVAEEISWKSDQRHGASTLFAGGQSFTQWYFEGKKVNQVTFEVLNVTDQKK